jgi:hypothetical protein
MRLKFSILIVCIFIFFNLSAQDYWKKDYTKIDSVARFQKATNLTQLSQKLTRNLDSTDEKYRALFAWVAYNISYDLAAYKNPKLRTMDAQVVFKTKKAVCAGYASLFKKLCELNQLPCEIISGSASTISNIGKQYNDIPNHDWNAIFINNQWYLCDVTWAAGYVDFSKNAFRFEFKPLYFCCPSHFFANDHFPKNGKWLLGANTSKETFNQSAYYYYPCIELNIQITTPKKGVISINSYKDSTFQFKTPYTIKRISIKGNNQKKSIEVAFKQDGEIVTFFYLPQNSLQSFIIYINNKSCLQYKVIP